MDLVTRPLLTCEEQFCWSSGDSGEESLKNECKKIKTGSIENSFKKFFYQRKDFKVIVQSKNFPTEI